MPMMDSLCRPSKRNQDLLTHLLRGVGQTRGFVLDSGRSYHYYGVEILSEGAWRRFLGKCLLMFHELTPHLASYFCSVP